MTNQEIFNNALDKAIKNGWNEQGKMGEVVEMKSLESGAVILNLDFSLGEIFEIIFSHNFAKAFWFLPNNLVVCDTCGAENIKDCLCVDAGVTEAWKYHLQIMVLEEDPIKYLEKFL